MARTGRRPGDGDTRGDILVAARTTFAAAGYHGATIRSIAQAAQVDPALVHHYFGTKEDLFAASVELPMRPADMAEQVLAGGTDEVGTRLARLFFTVWEEPGSRDALLAMLRGAFTTEQGAAVLREFFGAVLVERIADAVDGDDAALRMTLVAAHLVGVAVLRYVVRFPALADATVDEVVALVGPRLQGYVDGSA
jgi:AcrR family transcriptional regulator